MTKGPLERGQVGIGTLVVFLSMVLVASIAAGVLINTAGLLQGQAAATGAESSDGGAERLLVIGQTGEQIRDGTVGVVNLTVTTGPGADPIDLRDTTVSWVGPNGAYNVINHAAEGAGDGPAYHATALSDPDGSAPVVNEAEDRLQLTFDLGGEDFSAVDAFGTELRGGDMVKVTLVTGEGATTTTRLAVPASLDGHSAVVL